MRIELHAIAVELRESELRETSGALFRGVDQVVLELRADGDLPELLRNAGDELFVEPRQRTR